MWNGTILNTLKDNKTYSLLSHGSIFLQALLTDSVLQLFPETGVLP